MRYNHRNHAGNAGDVWKHLILAEVAEYLLAKEKNLFYIESHVGYPEYALEKPGEWQDGIGKCWKRLDVLKEFSYFCILDKMNPSGLMNYPGSAVLVLKATEKAGAGLKADVWDINPEVAASWHDITLPGSNKFRFHLGDGFSGIGSLMDISRPALLLIDPPYLERRDLERAVDLLEKGARSGWTVLLWQIADVDAMPEICCNVDVYSMSFYDVGMSCDEWRGATMTLAGSDDLRDFVNQRAENFLRIMRYPEPI
jgi:23S rRNA (adenine2030-N6)-methyltransferase